MQQYCFVREKILLIFLKKEFFRLKVIYLKGKKKNQKKNQQKKSEEEFKKYINNIFSFIEKNQGV